MLRVLAKIPHKEILFQYFQRNTIPISPKKYYHSISKEILITRSTSVVAPPWLDAVGSIFINKTITVFSLVEPAIDCLVILASSQSLKRRRIAMADFYFKVLAIRIREMQSLKASSGFQISWVLGSSFVMIGCCWIETNITNLDNFKTIFVFVRFEIGQWEKSSFRKKRC